MRGKTTLDGLVSRRRRRRTLRRRRRRRREGEEEEGGGMRRKAMVDATMPRACVGANESESPLQTLRPPDGRSFSKRLARRPL